jgi:hypothetical protein
VSTYQGNDGTGKLRQNCHGLVSVAYEETENLDQLEHSKPAAAAAAAQELELQSLMADYDKNCDDINAQGGEVSRDLFYGATYNADLHWGDKFRNLTSARVLNSGGGVGFVAAEVTVPSHCESFSTAQDENGCQWTHIIHPTTLNSI